MHFINDRFAFFASFIQQRKVCRIGHLSRCTGRIDDHFALIGTICLVVIIVVTVTSLFFRQTMNNPLINLDKNLFAKTLAKVRHEGMIERVIFVIILHHTDKVLQNKGFL